MTMDDRIAIAFRRPCALTANDTLELAAQMRETARAECRRAGMTQGRLPESKHEMQGKLSNVKPRPDRDARVLDCLSSEPIAAWRIQQRTGYSKSSVNAALNVLRADGKATFTEGKGRQAAQWVRT